MELFMDDTTKAILAGIVRHGLTTLGGILVAHGYIDSAQVAGFVGGGMIVAGAAWSWWQKSGQAQLADLLKSLTKAKTTEAAVEVAKTLPPGSAVTKGLP
jgi:hypothetical protein